jgi:hypothetical protein
MFKTMETRWELELPGDPRQVWDAFTEHAAAYLWPITYEPRVGGAERGLTSAGGTVTRKLYNHSLGQYVGHFAGREPHYLGFDDVPGTSDDVRARLGVPADAAVGDRVELGVIDYRAGSFLGIRTDDALIRLYGRDVWGWPVGVAVHTFDGVGDEPVWRERLIEKAVA